MVIKALSLYQDRTSLVHTIDPITKLVFILFSLSFPLILQNIYWSVGILIFCILLLLLGKVFKQTLPILGLSFLLLLSILVIQGLYSPKNETLFFSVGFIRFYEEGLLVAVRIILRVTTLLCSVCILVLTTKPSDLIQSLMKKGLPAKIGYVLNSVMQIIPEMRSTMATISDAQRSRGIETEGKLSTRIKAFFPLLGPVIMNALVSTRERSMALEVRGFNSTAKKSYLVEPTFSRIGFPLQIVMMVVLAGAIGWRIFQ